MLSASVVGVVKTILIIIGVLVVLRFLGQLMQAKNSMEEERRLNEESRKSHAERDRVLKNFGRTKILNTKSKANDVQDVDYEELD